MQQIYVSDIVDFINVGLLTAKGDLTASSGAGTHRYMYELYKNMLNNDQKIRISKLEAENLHMGNGLSFLFYYMFKNLGNYDIIHNPDFKPLLPLMKGKALWLSTAYDLAPILYPSLCDDTSDSAKSKIWLELILKQGIRMSLMSDFIIAISTQTRSELIKVGYSSKQIKVINVGVDSRFFGARRPHKNENFRIGYIGALRGKKNVLFAVNSMKHVLDNRVELEIWGRKEFMYNALLEASGGDGRIRFMGFAPENTLTDTYDRVDAFVFPSGHEGFGLPIIEAQARGLPVIIYKHGKIPNEVRKYCLEAEDEAHMAQIIEGLKENGYNDKLRKKATEYARGFTWEKEAVETLMTYRKLAGS